MAAQNSSKLKEEDAICHLLFSLLVHRWFSWLQKSSARERIRMDLSEEKIGLKSDKKD
jgi:hypothetical protein